MQLDESNLTGETKPCRKQTEAVQLPPSAATATPSADGTAYHPHDAVVPVAERTNIAFMGTLVRYAIRLWKWANSRFNNIGPDTASASSWPSAGTRSLGASGR